MSLKESQLFMDRFRNSQVPCCLLDPVAGCIEEASKAASELCGYSQELLRGMNISKLIEHEKENIKQMIQLCLIKEEHKFTVVYRTSTGELREMDIQSLVLDKNECPRLFFLMKDITENKLNLQKLKESQDKFQLLLCDIPSISVQGYKMDGTTFYWNTASEILYGYTREEAIGKNILDLIIPSEMTAQVKESIIRMVEQGVPEPPAELQLMRKDGSLVDVFSSHALLQLTNEEPELFCIDIDISEQKIARQLRLAASVFTNAVEPILITDPDAKIINANAAFTDSFGYQLEELLGRNPNILQSGMQDRKHYTSMWENLLLHETWSGEIYNKKKNGEIILVLVRINTVRDSKGKIVNYMGFFTDLTFLQRHEAELEKAAYYDSLTGLPNRNLLYNHLKINVTRHRVGHEEMALVYVDLDGFKRINDSLGHAAGDEFLRKISCIMQKQLRKGDTLARLGGDEFVAVLDRISSRTACIAVVERILEAARAPVTIGENTVSVSASIGVALCPSDSEEPDSLLRMADNAMYHSKNSGKNKYLFYSEMNIE